MAAGAIAVNGTGRQVPALLGATLNCSYCCRSCYQYRNREKRYRGSDSQADGPVWVDRDGLEKTQRVGDALEGLTGVKA